MTTQQNKGSKCALRAWVDWKLNNDSVECDEDTKCAKCGNSLNEYESFNHMTVCVSCEEVTQ